MISCLQTEAVGHSDDHLFSVSPHSRFCHGLCILSNHYSPRAKLKLLPISQWLPRIWEAMQRPFICFLCVCLHLREIKSRKKGYLVGFYRSHSFNTSITRVTAAEWYWRGFFCCVFLTKALIYRGLSIEINWDVEVFIEKLGGGVNRRQWIGLLIQIDSIKLL